MEVRRAKGRSIVEDELEDLRAPTGDGPRDDASVARLDWRRLLEREHAGHRGEADIRELEPDEGIGPGAPFVHPPARTKQIDTEVGAARDDEGHPHEVRAARARVAILVANRPDAVAELDLIDREHARVVDRDRGPRDEAAGAIAGAAGSPLSADRG